MLAAVVAGTGAITLSQAAGGPGPGLAEATGAEGQALTVREQEVASRSQLAGRLSLETAPTRSFSVTVDGATQDLTSTAVRLADALAEAGIVVGEQDRVSVGLSEAVVPGMEVTITRVTTERVTERTVEKHGTVEKEDPTLLEGRRVVETAGSDGTASVVYDVTRADGEVVGREVVARVVLSQKVDEVVRVGTRPAAATTTAPTPASTSSGAAAPTASYSGDVKSLGRDLAAARGWGTDQFQCLDALWTKESGWSHTATNPSSGAYGIPQSLPGSKMASAGADWRTNPATQITWGLDYISGRYGTPCGAWGHSQARGWY